MSPGRRQEVYNVLLAELLQERGVISAPESIINLGGKFQRRMPDVIVDYNGLRTAIEGEKENQPQCFDKALRSARHRVEEGIAHIGVAVIYPSKLDKIEFATLKSELGQCELKISIVNEFDETDFTKGDIGYLENLLRNTFDQIVKEDVVASAVAEIDAGIEKFKSILLNKIGDIGRLSESLGINLQEKDSKKQKSSICRISCLVIINALIFQEILAQNDKRIDTLQSIYEKDYVHRELSKTWDFIITKINYYPIFNIAHKLLLDLTSNLDINNGLKLLIQTSKQVIENKAALRHDLMGRVYHRLLADAKYRGTFYTRIPAATLILKLVLQQKLWNINWHNLEELKNFKVADLACGTGTLLMATADAITNNYISMSAEKIKKINIDFLQNILLENMLHGYDVLHSAIHLTASTLSMRSPHIPFENMKLFSLPFGGPAIRLGSIEFGYGRNLELPEDLFRPHEESKQVKGKIKSKNTDIILPNFDLFVMNPPFNRSVGSNLLFGSLPDIYRKKAQKLLKSIVSKSGIEANITAGLGSVFVAIADKYLKSEGRLALVLPKAVLSGVAWEKTRNLLSRKYNIEYIVSSHDPERWNFSENTDLSEILLIASKSKNINLTNNQVVILNLRKNPKTSFESLAIADSIIRKDIPNIINDKSSLEITLGSNVIGEVFTIKSDFFKGKSKWILPCAFAQSELIRIAFHLQNGELCFPGVAAFEKINLCNLGKFGILGPDRRDIHDGFDLSKSITQYPAFWGHKSEECICIENSSNSYLKPLAVAKKGRKIRKLKDLWPLASRILIVERFGVSTHKLFAIRLDKKVLTNVFWSFSITDTYCSEDFEKALCLWLNRYIRNHFVFSQ